MSHELNLVVDYEGVPAGGVPQIRCNGHEENISLGGQREIDLKTILRLQEKLEQVLRERDELRNQLRTANLRAESRVKLLDKINHMTSDL